MGRTAARTNADPGECDEDLMPLIDVPLMADERPIAAPVCALLDEAKRRIERYFEDSPTAEQEHAFVPSDFEAAYRALRTIVEQRLAPGRQFCEWGSGFGVVAALAAGLGLRATGIEVDERLVQASRQLARDFSLPVEFVRGNFVPEDEEPDLAPGEIAWLHDDSTDGWAELEMEPDEVDLIYAYPWPGEEHAIEEIFESVAADQALLLTYHGRDGVRLRRHQRGRRR